MCGIGWGPTQATIRKGVRWSTYRAYLRRILHEDKVHVLTHATAVKVCPTTGVFRNLVTVVKTGVRELEWSP